MFGNTNGCERILNFSAAEAHFNRTPLPRQRRRTDWEPHQRPLDNTRGTTSQRTTGTTVSATTTTGAQRRACS
jgi:hypothetical protein